MRKTKADAERTRDQILDAAEMTFFERGVARSSLDDIARAAGVTRGAVYWHFANKVELFLAMQDRAWLPQEDLCEQLADTPDRDPLATVADVVCDMFRRIATDESQKRVLAILLLRCEYTDEMADALQRRKEADCSLDARFGALFAAAGDRGLLHPAFTPALAQGAFRALVFGVFRRWLEAPEEMDLTAQGCAMVQAFIRVLGDASHAKASPA